jgi:hypothetical protein
MGLSGNYIEQLAHPASMMTGELCVLPVAEMMTAQLKQHQGQQHTSIGAVMTVTTANRILQHSQVFQIAEVQAGKTKLRRLAARTNHGRITIRGWRQEIQSPPTEGLLSPFRFRSTVAESVFVKE